MVSQGQFMVLRAVKNVLLTNIKKIRSANSLEHKLELIRILVSMITFYFIAMDEESDQSCSFDSDSNPSLVENG